MRGYQIRRSIGIALGLAALPLVAAVPGNQVRFTAGQVSEGKALYAQQCAACHGAALNNGEFGPQLKGDAVLHQWSGETLASLFGTIRDTMPPARSDSLSDAKVGALLAYILQENGFEPGAAPMPLTHDALASIAIPPPTNPLAGLLSDDVVLPPPPRPRRDAFAAYRPVTDAMLASPDEGDWLTWRRTQQASGFSPLKQIDRDNVGKLQLVWAWTLPNGPNESTPLVHDGVLFVFGQGRDEVIQALDAASGELLWQYTRQVPTTVMMSFKKAIALYGDKLFFATSDRRLVALDARSGTRLWEREVLPANRPEVRSSVVGGPIVADGKIVVGTTGQQPGGNFIVGFDPESGKELWRFATIPSPGTPAGDSWNGLPQDRRSGASVWTPGSYDPVTGLVYFGPAPTYDTAPLRIPSTDRRVTNKAFYSNHTVALDPSTGALKWSFPHRDNDQWDLDWAFERQVFELPGKHGPRRTIVTGGKEGIFDLIDAKSGAYLRSFDVGLQNFVTAIDPKTGTKTTDPTLLPDPTRPVMICPHAEGGKNWLPSAIDPQSTTIFLPLVESCMDMIPTGPSGGGLLSSGVKVRLRPRPNSDGLYGRLEAIDLVTGKPKWIQRRRAPSSSGLLATAGSLVFAGYMDRTLIAFDAQDGRELWQTRLGSLPSSNSITYTVGGRQYLAVLTSNGGHHAGILARLVPDIRNPPNPAATLSVFALPE